MSLPIEFWWGRTVADVPPDWTEELSETDRLRLNRMREALGLPDDRALFVHLIRWLVVGHRTAWLSRPLGEGVRFWLDNVAWA